MRAARREITEETGLSDIRLASWHIKKGIPVDIDTHVVRECTGISGRPHRHYDFRYVFYAASQLAIICDETELDDIAWVPIDSLADENAFPKLAKAFKKAVRFGLLSGG